MGKPNRATATTNEEQQLYAAARSGDLNAVQTICVANPLAINSRDKHSRTPLHLAAWAGHAQVVNYLCKNKADIGAAAMDDMGAVHFAAQKGHLEVVRILITSGVSVKSSTRKGMTALHFAAQGSHLDLVKYLVKKGANINAKNKAGKTAIDLASSDEIRSFLVECESAPSKSIPSGKEKHERAEPKSSSEDKKDETGDGVARDGDEEEDSAKRKNSEDEIKEKLPETKRAKVALNHLLSVDDTQEEEENL